MLLLLLWLMLLRLRLLLLPMLLLLLRPLSLLLLLSLLRLLLLLLLKLRLLLLDPQLLLLPLPERLQVLVVPVVAGARQPLARRPLRVLPVLGAVRVQGLGRLLLRRPWRLTTHSY